MLTSVVKSKRIKNPHLSTLANVYKPMKKDHILLSIKITAEQITKASRFMNFLHRDGQMIGSRRYGNPAVPDATLTLNVISKTLVYQGPCEHVEKFRSSFNMFSVDPSEYALVRTAAGWVKPHPRSPSAGNDGDLPFSGTIVKTD